ncbi:RAI1 domain-containing protein [Phanerochaete sordida]|uniref:Decapping nuclease n=1 Tax=Phanerochaete sordida TaxID=48140 RepID=A0A9P3LBX3_9APHY|nr:RAI1 domain-containing protein [Phanerochaete sordida]
MSSRKRAISEVEDAAESDKPGRRPALDHLAEDSTAGESQTYELSYPPKSKTAAAVPFQQPSTLLTFSYTPERVLEFTDSALRYYVDPPLRAELKYGYERWIKRPEEKGRLDGLLKAVLKYRSRVDAGGADGAAWLRDIAVVSWRGVMTKILTAPYEDRDGWELNVMLVDGTLYLEEHTSNEKLVEKEYMEPRHRLFSYFGYSFESYCTSSHPDRREVHAEGRSHPFGWGGDVDTNVQWCAVVKTKLGDQRLVIGGEVDCVRERFKGSTDTLVELKTSMTIRGPQDEAKFEKKLLKFYFQSFLLGVPEIVVGFRTPQGQISTTQSFKTIQIPRMVRGKPHAWDPSICLDWGHRFLQFLKSTLASQTNALRERSVWRARFSPGSGVTLSPLDDSGVAEVEAGEDRVGFLPKWYVDELKGRAKPSQDTAANRPAPAADPADSVDTSASSQPPAPG